MISVHLAEAMFLPVISHSINTVLGLVLRQSMQSMSALIAMWSAENHTHWSHRVVLLVTFDV